MSKNSEYAKFRNYERKVKSLFIIYADFESILVPENNRKQNPEDSYTMEFTTLLIVWSRKVIVTVMRWKSILTNNLLWLKKTIKIY